MFGHGTVDPVVGMPMGEASAQILEKAGFSVDFKKYRGVAHSSCAEEFGDIKRFLDQVLWSGKMLKSESYVQCFFPKILQNSEWLRNILSSWKIADF